MNTVMTVSAPCPWLLQRGGTFSTNKMKDFDWTLDSGDMKVLPAILYVSLSDAVTRYRELLQRGRRRGELDYMAWLTRNLVELRVWVEYCSKSTENAEEFYRDAIRDLADLNKKVGGLDADTIEELERARQFIGTAKPAHKYTHVSDAAKLMPRCQVP